MALKPRHIILTISLLCTLAASALPVELEHRKIKSNLLGREVEYSVIIPEGAEKGERYPVLYLLHGIGGDHTSWTEYGVMGKRLQKHMERGDVQPMIIVSPDGYLSYYSDAADGSMPYERFFTEELMTEVDSLYPTVPDRAYRAIGGFSMGGFGALTLGLRNRDKFCAIAALSPSIRTDEQYCSERPQEEWDKQWGRTFGGNGLTGKARVTDYYRARSPYHIIDTIPTSELRDMLLIVDIGDDEGTLVASNEQLHRRLSERGIKHTYRVRDGGHDFDCWNAAMEDILPVISGKFPKRKNSAARVAWASDAPRKVMAGKSVVYLPNRNAASERQFPTVYVMGKLSTAQRENLVKRTDRMTDSCCAPLAVCFLADGDTPQSVERLVPELRRSQRMRALVALDSPIERVNELLRGENLFTSVVLDSPRGAEKLAEETVKLVKSHSRYPRLWIVQMPESRDYPLASQLHVLLRKKDLSHQYRVRENPTNHPALLPDWEIWIESIDKRIHI